MTILSFNRQSTGADDFYINLRNRHFDYCMKDAVAACRAMAEGAHYGDDRGHGATSLLITIRGLQNTYMPQHPVDAARLLDLAKEGRVAEARAALDAAINGPVLDKNHENARSMVENYVLGDTGKLLNCFRTQIFANIGDIDTLVLLYNRPDDLREQIGHVIRQRYGAPSGKELHQSIRSKQEQIGLSPVPPRGRAILEIVRPVPPPA